jgi:hypothetical protein
MAKVDFTYHKTGRVKAMDKNYADILQKMGRGTYLTRDMAAQPVQQAIVQPQAPVVAPVIEPVKTEPAATFSNDLDSAGEAYDPAIHSAGREKKGDGTWRKRPGRTAEAKAEE